MKIPAKPIDVDVEPSNPSGTYQVKIKVKEAQPIVSLDDLKRQFDAFQTEMLSEQRLLRERMVKTCDLIDREINL